MFPLFLLIWDRVANAGHRDKFQDLNFSIQMLSALKLSVLDTKQLLISSVLRENAVATAMLELQRMCDKYTAKLDTL